MMSYIWWSLPLTLAVFFGARKLAARFKMPLLNPLLVAMVVIIPILLLTGIPYDHYFKGSEVLNDLLQPAVVALAYPLYEQLHQIRARWKSIIAICFAGSVVAMVTGTTIALLMGASPQIAASILPKSVTTPIAMAVSGSIAWMGLVVPHLARLLVGADHRRLLPTAFWLGAALMLVVDDLARTLTQAEIPIGIITALLGAPLFTVLLVQSRRRSTTR